MKKILATLLLTFIFVGNAAGGVTSAYSRVNTGDSIEAVAKKIGKADNGPKPYTSPVGMIYCFGWVKSHLVICFSTQLRVVWVGQYNSRGEKLLKQKGNKKLFLKLPKPKKPVDPRLTA